MALDTTFEFLGAVRGFHVYKEIWRPFEEELLKYDFENGNLSDIFAIKVCRSADHGKIIGHLPRVISRPVKFLIECGATVTATARSKNVRRPPLFHRHSVHWGINEYEYEYIIVF